MRNLATTIAAVLMLANLGMAFAADIYKWTDADGNVHFGDRPNGQQSERLAITSKPTDPARIQANATARAERKSAEAEAAANAPQGPTKEELRAQAAERAQKCDSHKEKLQKFVTSRRLYREDESGERIYLDEAQMQTARERAEQQVKEYCSG